MPYWKECGGLSGSATYPTWGKFLNHLTQMPQLPYPCNGCKTVCICGDSQIITLNATDKSSRLHDGPGIIGPALK